MVSRTRDRFEMEGKKSKTEFEAAATTKEKTTAAASAAAAKTHTVRITHRSWIIADHCGLGSMCVGFSIQHDADAIALLLFKPMFNGDELMMKSYNGRICIHLSIMFCWAWNMRNSHV